MPDSAAVWDLLANEQRPWTWTSADAAGLPIFPGLVRYDEVAAGQIQHAIRFTLPQSRAAMMPPASHWAANSTIPSPPPMGMRLRLKVSYDISGFLGEPAGHSDRAEEVRHDHGRQRQRHVHQRRARRPLGQRRSAQSFAGAGVGL